MLHAAQNPIQEQLFARQDLQYRAFQCRLMPTVDPDRVIGVRTPALRSLAKALGKTPAAAAFLQQLPHTYYEENNLHGLLLSDLRDYPQTIDALNTFLPHVDNWATCDLIRPKAFRRHPPELLEQLRIWMASDHPYTIRFAIEMLMTFYLDDHFQTNHLRWVTSVTHPGYYVRMMVAWYLATALAKQYDAALPCLEERHLDPWTHNKAIQKALESNRVTAPHKVYLRTLKQTLPPDPRPMDP